MYIPWMIWITDSQNSINDTNECALPLCEGSHTPTVVCHSGRVVIESYEEEGQAGRGSGGSITSEENNTKLPVEDISHQLYVYLRFLMSLFRMWGLGGS